MDWRTRRPFAGPRAETDLASRPAGTLARLAVGTRIVDLNDGFRNGEGVVVAVGRDHVCYVDENGEPTTADVSEVAVVPDLWPVRRSRGNDDRRDPSTPTVAEEWTAAVADPAVSKALAAVKAQWPGVPFPLLLRIALTEWRGDGSDADKKYQADIIADAMRIEPAEPQAGDDAEEGGGHG